VIIKMHRAAAILLILSCWLPTPSYGQGDAEKNEAIRTINGYLVKSTLNIADRLIEREDSSLCYVHYPHIEPTYATVHCFSPKEINLDSIKSTYQKPQFLGTISIACKKNGCITYSERNIGLNFSIGEQIHKQQAVRSVQMYFHPDVEDRAYRQILRLLELCTTTRKTE
jgi:hypothetical protein